MDDPELRLSFADAAALTQEFEQNLKHGRAYVRGPAEVSVLSDCNVVLVHPDDGAELSLRAQAVMVSDAGVGIELRPFDQDIAKRMQAFVAGEREVVTEADAGTETEAAPVATAESEAAPATTTTDDGGAPAGNAPWPATFTDPPDGLDSAAIDDEGLAGLEASMPSVLPSARPAPNHEGGEQGDDQGGELGDELGDHDEELDALDDEGDGGPDADDEATPSMPPETERQAGPSRHERLRKLSLVEQQKVARGSALNDRVMVERLFGKNVWDALLRNPRLTIPEVARIARKGTVPRPLLELIVDNNHWIQASTVRRALLGNPRINYESIMKLMRMTPKHELKQILKSTAYSVQVREAAKKVLG